MRSLCQAESLDLSSLAKYTTPNKLYGGATPRISDIAVSQKTTVSKGHKDTEDKKLAGKLGVGMFRVSPHNMKTFIRTVFCYGAY